MNIIHMKKPGVYKNPARALEPGKPFRMRDPKTYEWDVFIPVIVTHTIGACSQCAFCMNYGACNVRWEYKPRENNPLFVGLVGICTQHIKGFSFMRSTFNGSVVFKRADDLLEDL